MNVDVEKITTMAMVVGAISKELNIEPAIVAIADKFKIVFDVNDVDDVRYHIDTKELVIVSPELTMTQFRILAGIALMYDLEFVNYE